MPERGIDVELAVRICGPFFSEERSADVYEVRFARNECAVGIGPHERPARQLLELDEAITFARQFMGALLLSELARSSEPVA